MSGFFGREHECETCREKLGCPDLCALCLRRRALKPGERITDPALLCKGMRVQTEWRAWDSPRDLTCNEPSDDGHGAWASVERSGPASGWLISPSHPNSMGVTFLGWATEEAGEVRPQTYHERNGIKVEPPEPAPVLHLARPERGKSWCGAEVNCKPGELLHVVAKPGASNCSACLTAKRLLDPEPAPAKPVAVPFKRHHECPDPHESPTMCLNCETLMAFDTTMRDDLMRQARLGLTRIKLPTPPKPERYEPLRSGLGGICGGIWRVR